MIFSLLRMPLFGFFGLGFLLFCAVIAVAVWIAFRSGERGTTKLGGFAGCAIAVALVFVAGLGALGCTAIALLNTPNQLVRHGPVKSFEFHWDDEQRGGRTHRDTPPPVPTDDQHSAWMRVELHGTEPGEVTRWLRKHTDGDLAFTVSGGSDEGSVYLDIALPVSRREIRNIRRDLQRDFPNLRIPDGVKVELKDGND